MARPGVRALRGAVLGRPEVPGAPSQRGSAEREAGPFVNLPTASVGSLFTRGKTPTRDPVRRAPAGTPKSSPKPGGDNSRTWRNLAARPSSRPSVFFFWTVHGPFSFWQDQKENGGCIARPSSWQQSPRAGTAPKEVLPCPIRSHSHPLAAPRTKSTASR